MTARSLLLAVAILAALPGVSPATTSEDLSARVTIDGHLGEYAPDEIILGVSSATPERARDSRWGTDNDIHSVVVTWDRSFLYIGASASLAASELVVLVDYRGGGESDLRWLGEHARNIVVTGAEPDLVLFASPGRERAAAVELGGGSGAVELDADAFPSRLVLDAAGVGAFEAAIPWSMLGAPGEVRLVFAVTGPPRLGAGDAAPDPGGALSDVASDRAVLDRSAVVTIDAGGDGQPDAGVSPHDATVVEPHASDAPAGLELGIAVHRRSFAPDTGESTSFCVGRTSAEPAASVYVSCRVFDLSGRLVRVLYDNRLRSFIDPEPGETGFDRWDGTDRLGRVAPGGVYVINVTWAATRGGRDGSASAPVVVVR